MSDNQQKRETLLLEGEKVEGERGLLQIDNEKFRRSIGNKAILNFNPDTDTDRLVDINDNNARLLSGDPEASSWTEEQLEQHRNAFLHDVSRHVDGRLELTEKQKEKRKEILTGLFRGDPAYEGKTFIARFLPNNVDLDDRGNVIYVSFQVTPRKISPYKMKTGEIVPDCFMVEFVNVTELVNEINDLRSKLDAAIRHIMMDQEQRTERLAESKTLLADLGVVDDDEESNIDKTHPAPEEQSS